MAEIATRLFHSDFEPRIVPGTLISEAGRASVSSAGIGIADRTFRESELPTGGVEYVDMGGNRCVTIPSGYEGVVATSSLAGCTGVAAFCEMPDGAIKAMVAHYDSISQSHHFTKQDSPLNNLLYTFKHEVGEVPFQILVTYPEAVRHDSNFGSEQGHFDQWHYLAQIATTAAQLGDKVRVLFDPYHPVEDSRCEVGSHLGLGRTLAAGKLHNTSGIFVNGKLVDFDYYLNPDFDPDKHWSHPRPGYGLDELERLRISSEFFNNWDRLATTPVNQTFQEETIDGQTQAYSLEERFGSYIAECASGQYHVAVEHKAAHRFSKHIVGIDIEGAVAKALEDNVFPDYSEEQIRGEAERMMLDGSSEPAYDMSSVALIERKRPGEPIRATTFYDIRHYAKKERRLHRVDYVWRGGGLVLGSGKVIDGREIIGGHMDALSEGVVFAAPENMTTDRLVVAVSEPRYSDMANLAKIIPYLKLA